MRNQAATYTVTNAGDPETDVRLGDIQTDWQKIPGKVRKCERVAKCGMILENAKEKSWRPPPNTHPKKIEDYFMPLALYSVSYRCNIIV